MTDDSVAPPERTETEAEKWLSKQRTNRAAQYKRVIDAMGHDAGSRFDRERQAAGLPEDGVTAYVDSLARSIRAALRGPLATRTRRDPDLLFFGASDEETATAHVLGFRDGSAAVMATDAILSLCGLFAILHASYLLRNKLAKPGPLTPSRMTRASQRRDIDPIMAASLRYYLVQQRVFEKAAKKIPTLSDSLGDQAVGWHYAALVFVLAHETAHFALSHIGEDGYVSHAGPNVELEADALALEITEAVATSTLGEGGEAFCLVGAHLGVFATQLAERTLFVRTANTHPPAVERIVSLDGMRPREAAVAHLIIQTLTNSMTLAGDIGQPIEAGWWQQLRSVADPGHLGDSSSLSEDPIQSTHLIDQMCGQSREMHRTFLITEGQGSASTFAEVLTHLDAHDVERALSTLGVRRRKIETVTPAEISLTFSWLLRIVTDSPAMGRVAEDRRQVLSIVLARCFETTIREAANE